MLARYIGRDNNGFKTGGIYDLHEKIYHSNESDLGINKHYIILFNNDETMYLKYNNIKSILKDWIIME